MTKTERPRTQWLGRWGFVLAATGSAVGLGNVWKFPYMTGEYGGAAFVLVYLVCILSVGVPVMMTEIALGRRGRGSPIDAIRRMANESGRSSAWSLLGWMAMLCGFMILCFYVVVAGWSFAYLWKMISGGLAGSSVDDMAAIFSANNANPWSLGAWSTLVAVTTMVIVGKGVQSGIEKSVSWMMPGMVIMLVIMIGYGAFSGGFVEALDFLFAFNAASFTSEGMLAAMGHAFFTLSLASGAILTYGSYLPRGASIGRTTLTVAVADTLVALMAGLAIFPVIFANGMEPGSGPGLIFMSLPLAFQAMPLGTLFGILFFVMLSMAALTSSISMVEATVSWLTDNKGLSRRAASWGAGIVLWVISTLAMLSFNVGADWTLLGKHFFDWLDFLTSRLMMPLGGLGMALLAGFVLKSESLREELGLSPLAHGLWLFMVRYVSPLAILLIFVDALGWLEIDFAAQWPWLVLVLAVVTLAGELARPGLKRAFCP
ncbi:sodium-dependent transporter [Halomonas elongata]|uniref:Transporter n=1 Tax=Halomonas elongata (strain ATCC 33173 / DSM 2581 / NBRC 15536 / NCIMB 2198 / 1H9) TaxID=768066 RepID=E1VB85_HALED|nr:sodium-dependent transporter [Halomonas elongata]WBF19414.1 sodium-dependent transporter [Halomonas elongata]WPU48275.1 sodium-dependent transporter [Halomonas elongata DSM 2581]CBV42146.1 NSS family transport protein [Halomonas elongata DSM 2581]